MATKPESKTDFGEMPDDYSEDFNDVGDEPTDEEIAAENCGRWINGRLGKLCTKAGSEECDWECPYSR